MAYAKENFDIMKMRDAKEGEGNPTVRRGWAYLTTETPKATVVFFFFFWAVPTSRRRFC